MRGIEFLVSPTTTVVTPRLGTHTSGSLLRTPRELRFRTRDYDRDAGAERHTTDAGVITPGIDGVIGVRGAKPLRVPLSERPSYKLSTRLECDLLWVNCRPRGPPTCAPEAFMTA